MTLIRLDELSRVYPSGDTEVHALDRVSLEIPGGQFVALLGPSGSGKTTLLNMIGAIDRPSSGTIAVDGVRLGELDRDELTAYRRDKVGFVFQFFNLVPTLTATENVELIAALTAGEDAHARSIEALRSVELGEQLDRFPSQLSGGQQQRVAIARAIAKETPVLLCDEPTGALDRTTGREVLELLRSAASDLGRTVIVVSHDPQTQRFADRSLHLVDGRLVDDIDHDDGTDRDATGSDRDATDAELDDIDDADVDDGDPDDRADPDLDDQDDTTDRAPLDRDDVEHDGAASS